MTRTSRGLRTVRTGYTYQPLVCCTYRRRRAAWPERVSCSFGRAVRIMYRDTPGDGTATRTWIFISDIVDAFLLALKKPCGGFEEFNTGAMNSTTLNELIDVAEAAVGKKAIIQYEPAPPGDAHMVGHPSYDKITAMLGWEPKVSVGEGMQKLFKAYVDEQKSMLKADAATKMQATIRGNNAHKEQAVDPVVSVQTLAEVSSTLTELELSPAGKADGTDSWMAAARAAGWGPPVSGGAAVA